MWQRYPCSEMNRDILLVRLIMTKSRIRSLLLRRKLCIKGETFARNGWAPARNQKSSFVRMGILLFHFSLFTLTWYSIPIFLAVSRFCLSSSSIAVLSPRIEYNTPSSRFTPPWQNDKVVLLYICHQWPARAYQCFYWADRGQWWHFLYHGKHTPLHCLPDNGIFENNK